MDGGNTAVMYHNQCKRCGNLFWSSVGNADLCSECIAFVKEANHDETDIDKLIGELCEDVYMLTHDCQPALEEKKAVTDISYAIAMLKKQERKRIMEINADIDQITSKRSEELW